MERVPMLVVGEGKNKRESFGEDLGEKWTFKPKSDKRIDETYITPYSFSLCFFLFLSLLCFGLFLRLLKLCV